jgi:uncharacterized membrane protein YfcA
MDWTVYWFQAIACLVFATAATFSGITGAALMMPWFLLGFPLLGVPEITIRQAISAALFLEGAAFSVAIYRYARRNLIDTQAVRLLAGPVLLAAILGALISHRMPEIFLRLLYACMMIGAGWLLMKRLRNEPKKSDAGSKGHRLCKLGTGGQSYIFHPRGLKGQAAISGSGGLLTGLISTGIGELTVPGLVLRSGYPIPVAAATSIVLVAVADISAVLTHTIQFVTQEGMRAIPWNLIVWGAPGMAVGAYLGSSLQGRFSERASQYFFVGLFFFLGVIFLIYVLKGLA